MTTTITQNSNQSVIPVTVTNNVTKGDYVYQYGANIGWPKPTNVSIGATTFLLNPTLQSSNVATASARSVTASPMAESYTYTGATLAANAITTATTQVDASATHVSKSIGLVGGNFVNLFMSATNTLSAKVFNDAGVQQGSTLTLATNCTASGTSRTAANLFSGCGMADGGYVVVYKNTSTFVGIVRVNSSGAITFGPVVISPSHQVNAEIPKVCPTIAGGYLITFMNGAVNVATAIYSASNVYNTGSQALFSVNSYTPSYGPPYAIEVFPVPLILQNGATLIFINAGCIDGSYSYYLNLFMVFSLNSTATSVTTMTASTIAGASGGGYLSTNMSACGSTTDPSRWFAFAAMDASYQYPVFCTGVTTGASLSIAGTGALTTPFGTTIRQPALAPSADGGVNLYVWNGSNQIQVGRYNTAGTPISGGYALLTTVGSSSNYSLDVFSTGWKTLVNFTPNTTNIPSFLIHQTQTLANGTAFASTPYTPAQNYYLIGVAQNTATSGNTCWVQTEGVAQLGAGFASGNLLFDYVGSTTNSTAKSAIKGNSGTTSGTSVILKGLK